MLVDVRTKDEYDTGHHDQAINIPLEQIPNHDFGDLCDKIIVYCQTGGRARVAQMVLAQRGFRNVELLNGTGAY